MSIRKRAYLSAHRVFDNAQENMEVQQLVMKDERTPVAIVETGDETKMISWIAIMLGAGIAAIILHRKSKKQ